MNGKNHNKLFLLKKFATGKIKKSSATVFKRSNNNHKESIVYCVLSIEIDVFWKMIIIGVISITTLKKYTNTNTGSILLSSYFSALLAQRMRWLKNSLIVFTAAVFTIALSLF